LYTLKLIKPHLRLGVHHPLGQVLPFLALAAGLLQVLGQVLPFLVQAAGLLQALGHHLVLLEIQKLHPLLPRHKKLQWQAQVVGQLDQLQAQVHGPHQAVGHQGQLLAQVLGLTHQTKKAQLLVQAVGQSQL
jgi:hypothetical protein